MSVCREKIRKAVFLIKYIQGEKMNIFLTGATGFLGGKLIKNLISNTENELYVLVRDIKKSEKMVSEFKESEQDRIHLIKGDITKHLCGLTERDLLRISNEIDVFYHIAALVKFDLELREELVNINYNGTQHALDLALSLNSRKFFYISTAYTVGKNSIGLESLYDDSVEYNNPYEESKVKAEHLVHSNNKRMEVSIFRPSIIVGDSKTGEADSQYTLYGFMRALDVFKKRFMRRNTVSNERIRLMGSGSGTSNLIPVDYVSDILSLAVSKAKKDTIYNITNPNPPTNQSIIELIKESLEFDHVVIAENEDVLTLNKEEVQLNSMLYVYNPYLSRSIIFEDKNTKELIEGTDINHLNLTTETLRMIINAYLTMK